MSSLRNAIKRITHKERGQLTERKHLGMLEKKKDYQKRAKVFHSKENRIRAMKEKASMRNPDEFYFGMKNSVVGDDGRHRKTAEAKQKQFEEEIGRDTVRIMKDQDLSYVRMQKLQNAKKIDRLQSSLHFLEEGGASSRKGKHIIFLSSKEEAEQFDVAKHFDTLPELAGRAFNRQRISTLKKNALESVGYKDGDDAEKNRPSRTELVEQSKRARKLARKVARARSTAYKEMEGRSERVRALEVAEAHLVTEKLVAGKGRKRKIKGAENGKPAQYKFRRKRLG